MKLGIEKIETVKYAFFNVFANLRKVFSVILVWEGRSEERV